MYYIMNKLKEVEVRFIPALRVVPGCKYKKQKSTEEMKSTQKRRVSQCTQNNEEQLHIS